MKDVHELFKEAYEEANLEENSQYSNYPREELVIEAEYLYQTLVNISSEVMDGLYESRI